MDINLRNLTLKVLEDIYINNRFLNDALKDCYSKYELNKQQRRFIGRLVTGTIEQEIKIDYIISKFSKVKLNKLKKQVLYVLRLSIYQVLFMDNIPDSAICNEAVKLIKKRKLGNLSGYVNGVLRNIIRNIDGFDYPKEEDDHVTYLSIMYSTPKWLIQYLLEQYPYHLVKAICIDSVQTPKLTIRQNNLKCSKDELVRILENEGVKVTQGNILPYALYIEDFNKLSDLDSFKEGLYQVQDESSMLVGEIASPVPHSVVVDLCAAPGGKTTHIARLMNNTGKVYSRDISNQKISLIRENCERLGINNTIISTYDASIIDKTLLNIGDIVLADVPCSGIGIIKKKPDIKYNISKKGIQELITIQRNIMETAAKYVKKDGVLIYSTCTINKYENTCNVKWFLENHKEFQLEEISLNNNLSNIYDQCIGLQLLPVNNVCDGFYIAKLKRKA